MAIQPTLTLAAAGQRVWDAIVIGAGPAGALAARELALAGASVLLVDKATFPRWKVCGCCLNSAALETLTSAGLGNLVERHGGIAIEGLQLGAAGRKAIVNLPGERVLSRFTFDAALVEAAIGSGAHFLPATSGRLGDLQQHGRDVHLRHDHVEVHTTARVVLAASGLGSKLTGDEAEPRMQIQTGSRVGCGVMVERYAEEYRQPRIFMACGTGGYVGLVRVEDDRLNVAAAVDPGEISKAGGMGRLAKRILEEAGFPVIAGIDNLPWHGTPLLTRHRSRPAAERVFLIGDATGYVEPFTGEGMAWGLEEARAVAPLALRGIRHWERSLESEWTSLYRKLITQRQWVIRGLAMVLRRPWLAKALVNTLSRLPSLATPVVHYLNTTA